jgi:hypothetical protein
MAAIRVLVTCSAFFWLTTSALAQSFEGKWAAEMDCHKLSFTTNAVKEPFELRVSGATVKYTREIFDPDGSRIGTEEGTGIVSTDGKMTLHAVGKSAVYRKNYTGSYSGKLSGQSGTLRGTQVWRLGAKTEDRACTIMLKR